MKTSIPLLFAFLFCSLQAFAQCTPPSFSLGADTTVCIGDSVTLDGGGPNFLIHSWSTGSQDQSISVGMAGSYIYTGQYLGSGNNLVANGDFSGGNTGFTSGYIYGTGGTWGLLSNPGQYAISTNASLTHNNFASCSDHTTGSGNFMITNGSSIANTMVWSQTVPVTPNTSYAFSAWFTSVVSNSPGVLEFTINGVAIGTTFNLSSTTCLWQNFYDVWTSGPTQTVATIAITSQNAASSGNDFALDDIYFGELCALSDTINVNFVPYPTVNLGNDTVVCAGATYTIDVTDSSFTYQWSTGSTNPVLNVSNTDSNLWVGIHNGYCTAYDTLVVTVAAQPTVNIGPDQSVCPGDTVRLGAYWPNASYLWQDGSALDSLVITQSGTYWLEITDLCGTTRDSAEITFVQFPLADLGDDTTLCDGDTLHLSATANLDSYLWSTTASSSAIQVTQSGSYWVRAMLNACEDRDTVNVTFVPAPSVDLGEDTTFCQGQGLLLDATNGNATYQWNTGSTNPIFFVVSTGVYAVTASIQNCHASDSIDVTVIPQPVATLGADTGFCEGGDITLDVTQSGASYLWSTQDTTPQLVVNQSGTIGVVVSNACGSASDSIAVAVYPIPDPGLASSYSICPGDTLALATNYPNAIHAWSDGSAGASVMAYSDGIWTVAVTDRGCLGSDTTEVLMVNLPMLQLGSDTVLCLGESLAFDFSPTAADILWENNSNQPQRVLNAAGRYWVTLTLKGCVQSDSITLYTENCAILVDMPNVFTPNSDGQNDVFRPIISEGIRYGELLIYNRWGQEVFITSAPTFEWNGIMKNGNEAPDGVYYYTFSVTGQNNQNQTITGNITLTR